MSWTQPICHACWTERNPNAPSPTTLICPDKEQCCYCGTATEHGIYIRVDPTSVPFPSCSL